MIRGVIASAVAILLAGSAYAGELGTLSKSSGTLTAQYDEVKPGFDALIAGLHLAPAPNP